MDLKDDVEERFASETPHPQVGWVTGRGMMQRTAGGTRSAGHSEHKTSNSTNKGGSATYLNCAVRECELVCRRVSPGRH